MTLVTAVVCAGWSERASNVARIVADMQAGTVAPDTIIVLDNFSGGAAFARLPGVHVVAGHNWECRGKYVAGLLRFADFYLLSDDDMTVGPGTLERLLALAPAGVPNHVTANRAVTLPESRLLSHGTVFDAHDLTVPTPADVIYGSCAFMTHHALLSMLDAEARLRHKWPVEGDDILAGLANDVLMQPMQGDAAFQWLPDHGVAMQDDPGYLSMRDAFTLDALAALGK